MDRETIAVLQRIGLSKSEAKVYAALLELGLALAGSVARRAQINRSHCYDALQRLMEKGLVSHVTKARRRHFRAEKPEKLRALLERDKARIRQREEALVEITPRLNQLATQTAEKPIVTLYQGKRGIKSIFEDILRHKEYWVFGSSGKVQEHLGPYFKLLQKRVRERHIKVRLLTGEKVRGTDIVTHAETRYLPNEYLTLISTIIYVDRVAIISWTENPVGFLIEDMQTAKSYRSYFEFMWRLAKR